MAGVVALAALALTGCEEASTSRLVVLGIDGLERSLVERMVDDGELLNLARMSERGATAVIDIRRPILSPVVWTTYASGYLGEVHGIGGWTTGGHHAYSSADVRVWRIWDAATEAGVQSIVSGWLMSWPATPIDGHMLTDRFVWSFPLNKPYDSHIVEIDRRQHDRLQGTIWPPTDYEQAAAIVPTDAWLADHALGYQVEAYGAPFHPLRTDETTFAWFEHLWPVSDARIAMLYLGGADQVSHLYWPFNDAHTSQLMQHDLDARPTALAALRASQPNLRRPYPLPEGGDRADYMEAAGWVPDMYRYMDDVVGRAIALLRPGDTLVVLSDHGFRVSPSQPLLNGSHREEAMFLAYGARVRPGEAQEHMREEDVAPTLLALAGLPVADDMPGRVRDDMFKIEQWDTVPTRVLRRVSVSPPEDLSEAHVRMLQQLEALGYVDAGGRPIIGASRKK